MNVIQYHSTHFYLAWKDCMEAVRDEIHMGSHQRTAKQRLRSSEKAT